jgi:hypothetical protein
MTETQNQDIHRALYSTLHSDSRQGLTFFGAFVDACSGCDEKVSGSSVPFWQKAFGLHPERRPSYALSFCRLSTFRVVWVSPCLLSGIGSKLFGSESLEPDSD